MTINERLLQSIPDKVGVYLFKDAVNNVLYIGKAISLKKRVRQHFLPRSNGRKERSIRENTVDIEFLMTDTEAEALILENNLIKRYSPPHNIRFRDDKSYPSLKVTLQNDYPAIFVTRGFIEDGSRYFGPYTNTWGIRRVARYAQKLFGVRNCNEFISPETSRQPCLNHQMGMCLAPCAKKIEKDEYRKSVNQLCLFLEGKTRKLEAELEEEMNRLAKNLDFEKAALVRDRLNAVKKVTHRQRVSRIIAGNMDVVGATVIKNVACIQLFFVRDGNLMGGDQFIINVQKEDTPSEVITAFIEQRYYGRKDVPPKILVSHKLAETGFINDWFRRRGVQSKITTPTSELESELVELVLRNAEEKLARARAIKVKGENIFPKALIELRDLLGLDEVPKSIEGIDVSNIGGEDAVGALVTFSYGKSDKRGYRRYRIKTVTGIDDYAMIREVVRRRYERIVRERRMTPDLLLIDGGIGHLGSAVEELELLDIDIPVISIAKKREELYVPGESKPLNLEDDSKALKLIKKVRDEAHRFAISYHKILRVKRAKKSVLNEIRGVGKVKRERLMNRFGSIEKMRKASVEELADTPLVSKSLAQRIHEFLEREK